MFELLKHSMKGSAQEWWYFVWNPKRIKISRMTLFVSQSCWSSWGLYIHTGRSPWPLPHNPQSSKSHSSSPSDQEPHISLLSGQPPQAALSPAGTQAALSPVDQTWSGTSYYCGSQLVLALRAVPGVERKSWVYAPFLFQMSSSARNEQANCHKILGSLQVDPRLWFLLWLWWDVQYILATCCISDKR